MFQGERGGGTLAELRNLIPKPIIRFTGSGGGPGRTKTTSLEDGDSRVSNYRSQLFYIWKNVEIDD